MSQTTSTYYVLKEINAEFYESHTRGYMSTTPEVKYRSAEEAIRQAKQHHNYEVIEIKETVTQQHSKIPFI